MDTISRQISSIAEEARSRKLLSVILAFILATTLMVPHTAWAEGDEGGEGAQTTGVAKIGDTPYDTLQAAIDKAQADDTIVLTADTTESVTIAKEKSVTIDLGGCKLTNVDGKHTITNNGTLTVKGAGTVDNVSHARAALENVEGATAVLNGGAYTRSQENGQSSTDAGGNSFYVIRNHGALTINDGVDVSQNGHYSSMIENGYQNAGAEKKDPESVPSLTIAGGTFAGGLNTVKNDDCGVLEITGGTFTNVSQAVLLNWNVAKVSGGVFTATESSDGVILNGMNPGEINKGDLTITGGTFTAAADAEVISQMGGSTGIGTISISGGTFSATVEDFCAEGYSCTLVDGAYVVNETPAPIVAKIGNDEYASLKEAAEKAVAGDVVELLTDVESEPIAFENNVTVDLGAKTLTIVGDDAGTVDGLLFAGAGDNALKNGTVIDARSNGNQTAGWKAVHVSGAANLATENVAIQAYKPDTESNYNYLIYVGGKGDSKAKAVSLGAGTKLENLDNTASTSAVTYGAVGVALIGTTSDASAVAEKVSLTVAEGVSIDTMKKEGVVELADPKFEYKVPAFKTASGKFEFKTDAVGEAGLNPVIGYVPRKVFPKEGEFAIIGGKQGIHSHTMTQNIPALNAISRQYNMERLWMNAADAAELGIEDGDMVEVSSSEHTGQVAVRVTQRMKPGVVFLPTHYGGSSPYQTRAYQYGIALNDFIPFDAEPGVGSMMSQEVAVTVRKVEA